jgi:hypothetical protein
MGGKRFYTLGKKLGLTKDDVDQILQDVLCVDEPLSLSSGPPFYHGGGRYGTFSSHLFLKNNRSQKS